MFEFNHNLRRQGKLVFVLTARVHPGASPPDTPPLKLRTYRPAYRLPAGEPCGYPGPDRAVTERGSRLSRRVGCLAGVPVPAPACTACLSLRTVLVWCGPPLRGRPCTAPDGTVYRPLTVRYADGIPVYRARMPIYVPVYRTRVPPPTDHGMARRGWPRLSTAAPHHGRDS